MILTVFPNCLSCLCLAHSAARRPMQARTYECARSNIPRVGEGSERRRALYAKRVRSACKRAHVPKLPRHFNAHEHARKAIDSQTHRMVPTPLVPKVRLFPFVQYLDLAFISAMSKKIQISWIRLMSDFRHACVRRVNVVRDQSRRVPLTDFLEVTIVAGRAMNSRRLPF